ncbi:MAG: 16S rRNA (uracil(1498)-N(3))-methyltransferase [Eubacteriales bacterium]|nr:16S rRNA (uracil(1498)-N(3))-methyltransferase [Eubacteriales bacterium]
MHQFFVSQEQIGEKYISIEGTDVNHIRNVLRMKEGEQLTVCSGEDDRFYRCEIAQFLPESVQVKIMWVEQAGAELPSKLYLFQGLPKSDKMELIIQKAVELGVWEIIPVATKRAVVKLDAKKAEGKQKRWQAIAESAAKQCKRQHIPEVAVPMSFSEALSYAEELDVKLVPYELAHGMEETRSRIGAIKPGQSVAVFIGPEGGFDESEIEKAMEKGFLPITLGRRILRTETAGMTVLSVLMYHLEQ